MRQPSRSFPRLPAAKTGLTAAVALAVIAGIGFIPAAVGSVKSSPRRTTAAPTTRTTVAVVTPVTAVARAEVAKPAAAAPVVAVAKIPARVFATGNARLDALLRTLPPVLFDAGATVHFGWNPLDTCCHAGGYNPGPNQVWVGPSAFKSTAELTYVVAHELGHSLHLHSAFGPSLTAAVAGAPSVRPGSPWDVSEKVADCVAWVLYPAQTAAAGITYWTCPDPWRSQVRAALRG